MSEDKKYVHLSHDSVKLLAEQIGYVDLKEEVLGMVAEDCSYRLREATSLAAQLMRNNRRKKLTVEDFNRALISYDVPPIKGYGSGGPAAWKALPADPIASPEGSATIFHAEDKEIDVVAAALAAFNVDKVEGQPPIEVTAHWLTQETYPRVLTAVGVASTAASASSVAAAAASPTSATSSPQPHGSPPRKPSSSSTAALQQKKINETLLAYYDHLTKSILGKDEVAAKAAFADLRCNSRIGPLLPYLVNFISTGLKTLSHDLAQLKKLLFAAKALLFNCKIDLTPKPYLDMLLASISIVLLEPLSGSSASTDHWSIRDLAAFIIAFIFRRWGSLLAHLDETIKKLFQDTLSDQSKPLCGVYGAVTCVAKIGPDFIQSLLLPNMTTIVQRIDSLSSPSHPKSSVSIDAAFVRGSLVLAIEAFLKANAGLFRANVVEQMLADSRGQKDSKFAHITGGTKKSRQISCSTDDSAAEPGYNRVLKDENQSATWDMPFFYKEAYHHFGSSLAARLDEVMQRPRHLREPRKPQSSKIFVDPSAVDGTDVKSGVTMLHDLKRQAEEEDQRKILKVEESEGEEGDRSSDDFDHTNGHFENEPLVVQSHISDPGQGIKLTLKLTKRSRTGTPLSQTPSGTEGECPPFKKKKRSRSGRDASPSHFLQSQPVFEDSQPLPERPPTFDFRVLGLSQRHPRDLSRSTYWSLPVSTTGHRHLSWRSSSAHGRPPPLIGAIIPKTSQATRLTKAARSCSLFAML